MIQRARPNIGELFEAGTPIDAALARGIRRALLRHKKLGESIIVWQDGRVVELPAEEIPGECVPEDAEADRKKSE